MLNDMSAKPRRRVSREVSQQQTRQRLLEAARRKVAQGGVMAASIRGVCEAAGYSQGAFYSNFQSRDDLLLRLMESHLREEAQSLRTLVADPAGLGFDKALGRLSERLAELSETPEWSLIAVELQLHARRDAGFAARYAQSKAASLAEFARLVHDLVERYRLKPALPSLQIALGLDALWLGLAAQGAAPGARTRGDLLLAFFRAVTGAPALIPPCNEQGAQNEH